MRQQVQDWVWGWTLCRDAPSPVAEPDGFRVDVGKASHRVRFVLTDTVSVRRRAETLTSPGTWLKICGRRDDVLPDLGPQWVIGDPEFLMSTALGGHGIGATAPEGYSTTTASIRGFHEVVVRGPDGSEAARGRFAVHGRAAVVDQVVTLPVHRRRGLGRLVMSSIGAHAADCGARTAVLVSTVDGHGLYRSLGWTVDSEMVAAHLPEQA